MNKKKLIISISLVLIMNIALIMYKEVAKLDKEEKVYFGYYNGEKN